MLVAGGQMLKQAIRTDVELEAIASASICKAFALRPNRSEGCIAEATSTSEAREFKEISIDARLLVWGWGPQELFKKGGATKTQL